MDQTQTRSFTFTYRGQSVTVPLPTKYSQVALIEYYLPDGKHTSSILMASTPDHKGDEMIAELVNGMWKGKYEEEEKW